MTGKSAALACSGLGSGAAAGRCASRFCIAAFCWESRWRSRSVAFSLRSASISARSSAADCATAGYGTANRASETDPYFSQRHGPEHRTPPSRIPAVASVGNTHWSGNGLPGLPQPLLRTCRRKSTPFGGCFRCLEFLKLGTWLARIHAPHGGFWGGQKTVASGEVARASEHSGDGRSWINTKSRSEQNQRALPGHGRALRPQFPQRTTEPSARAPGRVRASA